ncbi:MAG: cell envelope integrity protein TolA [Hyphomicrobiales bacterium]|nr:cell envelope integrity protein TolA [Hyphomicrobiales bacterium]
MRVGLTASTIGHALVIAWGLISLPSAKPFPSEQVESLPVDILSVDEFTKLTKGVKTAELRPDPSPADPVPEKKPEAENPGKSEADKPSPKPEEKKVAALPPAAAPPPAPTPPTPKPPEQKPAEKAPEPPAPPAPTPEAAAPEPAPAPEPEAAPEPMRTDLPTPPSKPTPPKRTEAPRPEPATPTNPAQPAPPTDKKFDADQVAALLNKVEPSGGGTKSSPKPASLGSPTGRAEKMTQGELDALRGQIARCWSPPVGAIGAEALVVSIQMELNEDGSLAGSPRVLNSDSDPSFRAAADSAIRAVRRCAPYTLPPEKYAAWRDVKVNFDPRQMLGGW